MSLQDLLILSDKCEKLEAENAKLWDTVLVLKEGLEFYSCPENDNADNDWNNKHARQVLKELEDK